MNDSYKYSVIIPYYNSFNTIDKLLGSIPERSDIQVIVINDNCTTFESIDFCKYKNVNFICSHNGLGGAGTCRNVGLDNAVGEYVLFADSDDFFLDGAFEIIDDVLCDKYDVTYFVPSSEYLLTGERATRHFIYEKLINDFLSNGSQAVRYEYHVPWSKVIRRGFLEKNRIYFDEVVASNDVNFSLKVGFLAENVACIESKIYCVTDSTNSLTKKKSLSVAKSRFQAFCRYNDYIRENSIEAKMMPMLFFLRMIFKVSLFDFFKAFIIVLAKKYPIFK